MKTSEGPPAILETTNVSLLPAEAGDQHSKPPAHETLGVVFALPPAVSMGAYGRQQISRWKQRLMQLLFGGDARGREGAHRLMAHDTRRFPPPWEVTEPPRALVTREFPDGAHPGR